MTSQHKGFMFMALGFAVWIAALSMMYGMQATGCAFSWQNVALGSTSLLRIVLLGLFAGYLGLLLWIFVRSRHRLANTPGDSLDAFLWRASAYLTLAALGATMWIGSALVLPGICR